MLHLLRVRGRAQRLEHHRAQKREEPASTGQREAVPARRREQRRVRMRGSHPAVSASASAPTGEPPRRRVRARRTEKAEVREDGAARTAFAQTYHGRWIVIRVGSTKTTGSCDGSAPVFGARAAAGAAGVGERSGGAGSGRAAA